MPLKIKIHPLIFDFRAILFVYASLALIATIQSYFGGPQYFLDIQFTHYNNYLIFKQSFYHLIQNQNLYTLYLTEHWDFYKYSPTFSFLFAPFAILPDYAGLFLWNLTNAVSLFIAIRLLPNISDKNKTLMLWFISLELMTSLQNEQSNALIAGLIILAFVLLEKKRFFIAILLITFTAYIKIFGMIAFVMLLFYPQKIKNTLYAGFWIVVLAALPLLAVSFTQLKSAYLNWNHLLSEDQVFSYGLSLMGWLITWFKLFIPKMYVILTGIILFCIPLLRTGYYRNFSFRLLTLSSLLTWVVIFNPKAESPTFIIAISGIAIWYFSKLRHKEDFALLILALILTQLSPTDIFPPLIRDHFLKPYVIKAIPCILIWFKLLHELMFFREESFEKMLKSQSPKLATERSQRNGH